MMPHHCLGETYLIFSGGDASKCPHAAQRKYPVRNHFDDIFRHAEQLEAVSDVLLWLVDPFRDLLQRQAELLVQLEKALGLLKRIEIAPMQILCKSDHKKLDRTPLFDNKGSDVSYAFVSRGARPTRTNNKIVETVIVQLNDNGLQLTLINEGFAQFIERLHVIL